MEKGEKEEKGEKTERSVKSNRVEKKYEGKTFLQVISIILIVLVIAILLIVVQVPYITTNVVNEKVPVENCSQGKIPFIASFRSGLKYDGAPKFTSSEGVSLRGYTELKPNVYVNIRNMGDEKGIYCVKVDTYYVNSFRDEPDKLETFQNLLSEGSERIKQLENDIPNSQICTENPILPKYTETISFWSSNFISDEIQEGDLRDVYILFTVVAPSSKDCALQYVEQEKEQEVTRYCNAWKHLVGKC